MIFIKCFNKWAQLPKVDVLMLQMVQLFIPQTSSISLLHQTHHFSVYVSEVQLRNKRNKIWLGCLRQGKCDNGKCSRVFCLDTHTHDIRNHNFSITNPWSTLKDDEGPSSGVHPNPGNITGRFLLELLTSNTMNLKGIMVYFLSGTLLEIIDLILCSWVNQYCILN